MALDEGSSSFRDLYRSLHTSVVLVGAAFVLVALLVSLWLILQHLRSYSNPEEQKWIIAVLFMVPVYASESIISLWHSEFSLACDILRNCYEAFALYAFGRYLVACLGGERQVFRLLENKKREELTEQLLESQDKAQVRNRSRVHIFFWDPNALGERLYTIIKFGLVQYTWALYCLVKFYNATHEKLQEIRPLAKFISFKAIVFATWWQGLGIAIICHIGILPKEGKHIPVVEHGEITSEESKLEVKVDSDDDSNGTPTTIEEKETHVEAPGTSIKESVQDVVIGGGHHVVKDVALTISQAIGPVEKGVEKGVGKIQDTFHHISLKPKGEKEPEVEVEEHITENTVDGEPVAVDAEVEVERTVQDDNSMEGESLVVNREVAIERIGKDNKR
uniref:Uncharacterized protein n=1 Tax=Oryza barthii TaxID=65489 RepID=A0A0D3FJN5_9ORYZ